MKLNKRLSIIIPFFIILFCFVEFGHSAGRKLMSSKRASVRNIKELLEGVSPAQYRQARELSEEKRVGSINTGVDEAKGTEREMFGVRAEHDPSTAKRTDDGGYYVYYKVDESPADTPKREEPRRRKKPNPRMKRKEQKSRPKGPEYYRMYIPAKQGNEKPQPTKSEEGMEQAQQKPSDSGSDSTKLEDDIEQFGKAYTNRNIDVYMTHGEQGLAYEFEANSGQVLKMDPKAENPEFVNR